MADNNYINTNTIPAEKGGIAGMSGCLEHTRVVTQLIREARINKGNLTVLWLNLATAYSSLPHKLVQHPLLKHHLPSRSRYLISIYENNFSMRVSSDGITSGWQKVTVEIINGCTISFNPFHLAMYMLI